VAWVFSPDLDGIVDDELDEDPERILPNTLGGSQRHRCRIRISYTILGRKKQKKKEEEEEEKNKSICSFFFFFF
jgi:hypothetical protein